MRIPVVIRDGRRALGHRVLLALLAAALIANLWIVWTSGAASPAGLLVVQFIITLLIIFKPRP